MAKAGVARSARSRGFASTDLRAYQQSTAVSTKAVLEAWSRERLYPSELKLEARVRGDQAYRVNFPSSDRMVGVKRARESAGEEM